MQFLSNFLNKKSEKYNLNLNYIIKNFFYVGGEQLIGSVLGLVVLYAMANYLSPTLAGEYKYILSLAAIISSFTITGMMYGVSREVALGNDGIMKYALNKSLRYNFIPILVSLLVGGYYIYKFNSIYGLSIILATTFTTFTNSFLIYKYSLSGKENFKLASNLTVCTNIIVSIISFVAFYFLDSIYVMIIIILGSQLLITLYLFYKYSYSSLKLRNLAPAILGRYDKYVNNQSMLNLFTLTAFNLDKVILFQLLGPRDLAIYAFSTVVIDRIRGVIKSIGAISYPKFVKADMGVMSVRLKAKMWPLFLISTIILILTLYLTPYIYKYLLPQYYEYYKYAMIYSLSIYSVLSILPYTLLQAKNVNKSLYIYEVFNGLIALLSVIVGIYFGGLMGAIIGRTIASGVGVLTIYMLLGKETNKS